jgi:hypothetical protein
MQLLIEETKHTILGGMWRGRTRPCTFAPLFATVQADLPPHVTRNPCMHSQPRSMTSSDGSGGLSSEKRQRFEAARRAHYNMREALRLGRCVVGPRGCRCAPCAGVFGCGPDVAGVYRWRPLC